MHRFGSTNSLSSEASYTHRIKSDKHRKLQAHTSATTYTLITSTPNESANFRRKRERTRSSLYSLDDGNDSGVYDRLKTPAIHHTRTPSTPSSIFSKQDSALEYYDLTLEATPSLLTARKLTYSALSLESTSSASSTSCINSNSLESNKCEEARPIQKSPKIVYDELFYKELDKLQTEFTDITSIMSIVDARLDNILCNTELALRTQHRCHNLLDNLELDVNQTRNDSEQLEWLENRQSRLEDSRHHKNNQKQQQERSNHKSRKQRAVLNKSEMPSVDRFLDEYYLALNPTPLPPQQKQTLPQEKKTPVPLTTRKPSGAHARKPSGANVKHRKNSRRGTSTSGTDTGIESSRSNRSNISRKSSRSNKSQKPHTIQEYEYDTAHMDAVITQALASCHQKKPSMRKKLMKRLSDRFTDSSTGYCSYAGV